MWIKKLFKFNQVGKIYVPEEPVFIVTLEMKTSSPSGRRLPNSLKLKILKEYLLNEDTHSFYINLNIFSPLICVSKDK